MASLAILVNSFLHLTPNICSSKLQVTCLQGSWQVLFNTLCKPLKMVKIYENHKRSVFPQRIFQIPSTFNTSTTFTTTNISVSCNKQQYYALSSNFFDFVWVSVWERNMLIFMSQSFIETNAQAHQHIWHWNEFRDAETFNLLSIALFSQRWRNAVIFKLKPKPAAQTLHTKQDTGGMAVMWQQKNTCLACLLLNISMFWVLFWGVQSFRCTPMCLLLLIASQACYVQRQWENTIAKLMCFSVFIKGFH